jgi:hypothetical protein
MIWYTELKGQCSIRKSPNDYLDFLDEYEYGFS